VWMDIGNDKENGNDIRIGAGEWYVLGDELQRFYLPVDTVEGSFAIDFRSVAVNGTGQEEKTEKHSNTQPANYGATETVKVYITGRLCEFTLYEVGGTSAWEEANESVYTVGRQADSEGAWNTLPLRIGVHPYYRNLGGLPRGGTFKLRIKSIGSSFAEEATLRIVPQLVSVTGDGYEAVDVYYEEVTENGVYLRRWDTEEQTFFSEAEPGAEIGILEWHGTFSLPERLYVAEQGTDVVNYQARFGLTFSEEFWQTDAILVLRFAITITNTEGETLYYGMLPDRIVNNIWQKESVDSYREDKKGNRFEILGGEVVVIYPGDVADGAYTTDGIY